MHVASWIIAGIYLVLAAAGGMAAFVFWSRTRRFLENCLSTIGTVTEIHEKTDREGGRFYYPVYDLSDATGTSIKVTSETGYDHCPMRVGDRVEILYDPCDPETARANRKWDLWLLPFVFAAGTFCTLLQAALCLVFDAGRWVAGMSFFQ